MTERDQAASGGPLFQNLDEQERIYAPQQVPGGVDVPDEIDAGGTAGGSSATVAREGSGAAIAGAEGDQRTTTVVPVRPDMSANTPIEVPATPDERRLADDEPR